MGVSTVSIIAPPTIGGARAVSPQPEAVSMFQSSPLRRLEGHSSALYRRHWPACFNHRPSDDWRGTYTPLAPAIFSEFQSSPLRRLEGHALAGIHVVDGKMFQSSPLRRLEGHTSINAIRAPPRSFNHRPSDDWRGTQPSCRFRTRLAFQSSPLRRLEGHFRFLRSFAVFES